MYTNTPRPGLATVLRCTGSKRSWQEYNALRCDFFIVHCNPSDVNSFSAFIKVVFPLLNIQQMKNLGNMKKHKNNNQVLPSSPAKTNKENSTITQPQENAHSGFNITEFEKLCFSKTDSDVAKALDMLRDLLMNMSQGSGLLYGDIQGITMDTDNELPHDATLEHCYTRIANAIGALFLHPQFNEISYPAFKLFMMLHIWLSRIFQASSYHNADHIIAAFNTTSGEKKITFNGNDFRKVLLLYNPESGIKIDTILQFWPSDPMGVTSLMIALLSSPFCGSKRAHEKKQILLRELPKRLMEIQDPQELPLPILLCNTYMNCSYAEGLNKEDIKKTIHQLARQILASHEVEDFTPGELQQSVPKPGNLPTLVVMHEWMHCKSAMYRCYAPAIKSLKKHFNVIGVGRLYQIDEVGMALFDRHVALSADIPVQIQEIYTIMRSVAPAVIYMPSIGMEVHTVLAASLRFAPLQIMSGGHPASTHSQGIDYIAVQEDVELTTSLFSEQPLYFPVSSFPMADHPDLAEIKASQPERGAKLPGEPVIVAVSATSMKLSMPFLAACRSIRDQATQPLHFRFFLAEARGISYHYIKRIIHSFLGNGVSVFPVQDYKDYMRQLRECDLSLSPFPFGHTNTIYDCSHCGVVSICLDGPFFPQTNEKALFKRLGLPAELVTPSVEEYISRTVSLIDDHEKRSQLSQYIQTKVEESPFTQGEPEKFGDIVYQKYLETCSQ